MREILGNPSFLRRTFVASLWLGLLAGLFVATYAGLGVAGRYLLFLGWMLANLLLWAGGVREFFGRRRGWALAAFVSAKLSWLAVLMILCWWAGLRPLGNFLAFLLGVNTPFLVGFLKALGYGLTRGSAVNGQASRRGDTRAPSDHTAD